MQLEYCPELRVSFREKSFLDGRSGSRRDRVALQVTASSPGAVARLSSAAAPRKGPFFRPFRGSFSAVSTPIFATKGAFFSVFRALHFFLCTAPDFPDFSEPLHQFCKIQRNFRWISRKKAEFCTFLIKFSPNFSGISKNISDFDSNSVKMMIFHRHPRKNG